MSPAGFRDRARGQGIRGQSPLKLNTFLCCDMPEIVQSCYVYEQRRQSRNIGGHKRRLEVQGSRGGALVEGLPEAEAAPETEAFFRETTHTIFPLKGALTHAFRASLDAYF